VLVFQGNDPVDRYNKLRRRGDDHAWNLKDFGLGFLQLDYCLAKVNCKQLRFVANCINVQESFSTMESISKSSLE
jgi:hypothetical protein